jgi:hypothetical protein
VQRATAQPKTGIFRDYSVAEAPPSFKQAGLTAFIFSLSLSLSLSLSVHFACSSGFFV